MKLSQFKNEDALDLLAEILDPAIEILTDAKVQAVFTGKKFNKVEIVKLLLSKHKESIIKIMAALNGEEYENYEFNIVTGTKQLLEMMNDEELISFFQSQGQTMTDASSGSAMGNIKATGKK